jgi:hypothetical protein
MKDINEVKQKIEERKDLELPERKEIVPVDPQALLSQAVEKNLPIETMERLFALRRELKAEMAKDAYYSDLSLFQEECPIIEKKKNGAVTKSGKVKYKYAPLEDIIKQVKSFIKKYGFSYIIKTKNEPDKLTAICEVHHNLGHTESVPFTVPIEKNDYMTASNRVASASTYAKRYAFCNAFGIVTMDSDDDSIITGQDIKSNPNPINEQSNEAKDLYRGIMHLINEKYKKYYLFNKNEKIEFKKGADIAITDIDKLNELHGTIIKISAARKQKMDEEL